MARRRVGLPYPGDVQLMLHGCHMQHGCHISRDVCTAVREERIRYMTSPRNDGGASHDGRDRKARRDDGNGGSGAAPDHSVDSVPLGGGGVAGVPIRPDPAGVPRCKPSSTQPLDGLGLSIRVVVTAMSQKRIIHTNKIHFFFNRSSARFGTAPYKYSKISNLKKLGRRGRHQ